MLSITIAVLGGVVERDGEAREEKERTRDNMKKKKISPGWNDRPTERMRPFDRINGVRLVRPSVGHKKMNRGQHEDAEDAHVYFPTSTSFSILSLSHT